MNLKIDDSQGQRKCFQFFAIEDNVCCGFVICGFYYDKVCSFYTCFLGTFFFFIINGCWIVKGFLCIYWDNHMVLLLQFVNMVYQIDWFANIEESLHPWDKANLVMMCDLFNMLLFLFARILLSIFAPMYVSDTGLWFSFFVASFSEFGIRVMVDSQNEFGSLPSSAIFWKTLRRTGLALL